MGSNAPRNFSSATRPRSVTSCTLQEQTHMHACCYLAHRAMFVMLVAPLCFLSMQGSKSLLLKVTHNPQELYRKDHAFAQRRSVMSAELCHGSRHSCFQNCKRDSRSSCARRFARHLWRNSHDVCPPRGLSPMARKRSRRLRRSSAVGWRPRGTPWLARTCSPPCRTQTLCRQNVEHADAVAKLKRPHAC